MQKKKKTYQKQLLVGYENLLLISYTLLTEMAVLW